MLKYLNIWDSQNSKWRSVDCSVEQANKIVDKMDNEQISFYEAYKQVILYGKVE